MTALIIPELVTLDTNSGSAPSSVIHSLATLVASAGRATDVEALFRDALAREEKTSTGVPGGIAIPHCSSTAVTEATLAMARLNPGVDFGAKDGPADLVFFIAAPEGADKEHLKLLSKLARSLVRKDFPAALRAAASAQDIVALVLEAVGEAPAHQQGAVPPAHQAGSTVSAAPTGSPATASTAPARLVAVTACPTGIAHTYMAADSLAAAAKEAGVDLQVETQGSAAAEPLDPAVIEAADAVIFAVDVDVRDKDRFSGKPVVSGPVKRGISEPAEMVAEALAAARDPQARRVSGTMSSGTADSAGQGLEHGAGRDSVGSQLKRALLTGVSYIIPFVAAGGLLIALGFLLGGYDITDSGDAILQENSLLNLPEGGLSAYLGAVSWKIGSLSMAFLVPALAGYIAYAIADRPGIAPGFTAGAVAGFTGAGFLGGIIGGLLAGYVSHVIGSVRVPRVLRSLMPVVIIPLLGSIIASGLMFIVLAGPLLT